MYKAGRKWLVAGISALSGLLGLGTISTTGAKADTKAGAAQQLDSEDVAATQTTGTIPATSQTQASTSTTEQETSTTPSQSTTSTSTDTDTANATTNKDAATTTQATGSTTGASSTTTDTTTTTTDTTNQAATTSGTTTTTDEQKTTADTTSNQTSTTNQSESANDNKTTGSTSQSTSSTEASTSGDSTSDLTDADAAAATTQLRGMLRMAMATYSISADELSAILSTPGQYTNSDAYNAGLTAALTDINNYIKEINLGGLSITNLLSNNVSDGVSALSNLYTAYQNDNSLQYNYDYGEPTWQGSSYVGTGVSDSQVTVGNKLYPTKDYNQGYADYARAFAQGLSDWFAGVSSSKNSTDKNELLNAASYSASDLDGSGSAFTSGIATSGVIVKWASTLIGSTSGYADNTLSYDTGSSNTNIAKASVGSAVSALKLYVKIIAPYLVNGIATQALSDVRSIGGTLDDDDYAPKNLSEAVGLNKDMQGLVNSLGLTPLLDTPLLNGIYDAIKGNVQTAIEANWAKGEQEALTNFLVDGSIYGNNSDGTVITTSPYSGYAGYSETNPATILTQASSSSKLSDLAKVAGYAWTQKIIGNVFLQANIDALGGTKKTDTKSILDQLVSGNKITQAEEDEIINDAAHQFSSTNSALDYTRSGAGARTVIDTLYNNEYDAITSAIND